MRLKTCFAALVILLSVAGYPQVFAQQKAKIPRILILLDGSSSMNEDWNNGRSRFSEAGRFILSLIDSMSEANESVEFGLRVFGHQYPAQQKNCYDTKREVPFFPGNRTQMQSRLESLHGYGVSPIAYALSEAATEDFGNEDKYAYSIVLVTDGGESCDGDICKVVQELLQRKIFFRPYIVSLSDYAPLRDLYACLGTFLTVTKDAEVPVVIHKIVDAHREGFERAKTGTTRPVLYRDSIPPVVKAPEKPKDTLAVKIVEKTPERDRRVIRPLRINQRLKVFMEITVDILEPVKIDVPPFVWSKRDPVPADPVPVAVVKTPEPVLRKAEKQFARLRSAPRKSYPSLFTIPTPKKQEVPPFVLSKLPDPAPVVLAPAPVRKAEKPIAGLKPAGRKILSSKAPSAVPAPKKLVVPAFVLSKLPEAPTPAPVVADRPLIKKTTPPVATDPKSTPFTVEKDPAAETLLEVYFTDGHGKFYSSNPQILLTDPASGKVTQKFYRTVDPNGNPDQQKIPAGTYNLSVAGSDRTFLRNVVINPNANNKVIITVTSGSLQFSYTGRNAKKPVDKYFAIVKRNFEPLPVVKQDCDTQLFYPPGNYHIEVNTLPPTIYSVDLSFGVTVMLPVAEPGTVIFSNMANLGKIRLYYPLGDKFVQFHTMNITGDPARQSVELKPGMYQVYYSLAPGMPERVLTFPIRSNETTTIELK